MKITRQEITYIQRLLQSNRDSITSCYSGPIIKEHTEKLDTILDKIDSILSTTTNLTFEIKS